MTKYEFLGDLSRLLSDLSEEERSEALQYYEDYFADAGREQEQAVIQELESPEKVAAKIHGTTLEEVEYGEQSEMRDAAYPEPRESSKEKRNFNWQKDGQTGDFQQTWEENRTQGSDRRNVLDEKSNRTLKWVLIITLIIVAIPIVLPVVTTLFGLLIAVIAVFFALFCALFGSGIGLGVGGIVSIFVGLYHCMIADFANGILDIGVGLVLLPVGIILCYFGVFVFMKLLPGIWKLCQRFWKWLCNVMQRLFGSGEGSV